MKRTSFLLVIVLFIGVQSCKKEKSPKIDEGFKTYISGFTSGVISVKSPITIRFNEDIIADSLVNKQVEKKLFRFKPKVDGIASWEDRRTLIFTPAKKLKSGQKYEVNFLLEKLKKVPSKLKKFSFYFKTLGLNFKMDEGNLLPYSIKNPKKNSYTGVVFATDFVENEPFEKILSAKQDGKDLPIKWNHYESVWKHDYVIDSVNRGNKGGFLILKWNGKNIGVDFQKTEEIQIPGINEFKITNVSVINKPEQYILVRFSDPLLTSQNFNGLIDVVGAYRPTIIADNNTLKIYPKERFSSEHKLTIAEGIKSVFNRKLQKDETYKLSFQSLNPALELIGKGTVIPESKGLIFPFRAVNLNAVDLRIIKIYVDNIAQFLQVNEISGKYQLSRVGRLIYKKKVKLTSDQIINYGIWNNFSIDLADHIQLEQGAIYKIELGFKKAYSLYPCEKDDKKEAEEIENIQEDWDSSNEGEVSYWDASEEYYSNYYSDYVWNERNDPCKSSYYHNKKVSRNVLASNLGIIAKMGMNKTLHVATTDILTAKPVGNAEIKVYSYQQQKIGSGRTNSSGLSDIALTAKPFLLVAKNGNDINYLKLIDGGSLSLSKFDVGGQVVQKGIKGFLYGERGVWRPGDTLNISFILEDEDQILPPEHPVVFELYNPLRQLVKRTIKKTGMNDFYVFPVSTKKDAPTGNWFGKVHVGGVTFSKTFKIETVKPNRLKIELEFGNEIIYAQKGITTGKLKAKWLHGATARNLKAKIEAKIFETRTKFDRYKEYDFNNPGFRFRSIEKTIFDGQINNEGEATINADFKISGKIPGTLKTVFTSRVFEKGGDFSINKKVMPVISHDAYVGIKLPKGDKSRNMLLTDTDHKVEVATVDAKGMPISVDGLQATVYKVNWRWWWERSPDNLSSYFSRRNVTPIIRKTLSTKNGTGTFTFQIKYPDWGRYFVMVKIPKGHSCGKTAYIDWPGWAGRAQKDNPGGASMLIFSSDKTKYNVGEKIKITLPGSKNGRALISIENGSKVLNSFWLETSKGENRFEFAASEIMSPNAYIHITLLQPHAQTANDLPIRLYGIIPIIVEDPQTKLNPELIMAEKLEPEKNVEIKVKEKKGSPMTYTIAMVDEGLLDLTNFKTPDPWSVFYAREALGIKTWDLFEHIAGAYGGKLEQLLALGGDEEQLENENEKDVNRFKPVVKFLGPFELKAGKTATHNFKMPNYIGSVRTMLIARNKNAYGAAEKTTPVKQPLMVLATLPRVLGPGEKVKLPVSLFVMDEKIKNILVEISTEGLLSAEGKKSRNFQITEEGETYLDFDLKTEEALGTGKVHITAKSGKHIASYNIELNVRNANPPITKSYSKILKAGESIIEKIESIGMTGTNEVEVEVSSIPPINLGKRLKYLIRYPHGCVEQTTSSVFPQLFLENIQELDQATKTRITNNVLAGIERLASFQLSGGGFSYWPGNASANEWSSTYAGHFLLEAERKGFFISPAIKNKWIGFQQRQANNWNNETDRGYRYSDHVQAYRLYTLALAGKPALGAMNRLREKSKLTMQAQWRLAAAYALAGKESMAKEIVSSLSTNIPEYREMSYSFGSGLRDKAMILETLSLLKDQNRGVEVLENISNALQSERWMSTQTTAYALIAFAKFVGENNVGNTVEFSYKFDNNSRNEVQRMSKMKKLSYSFDIKKEVAFEIENKGEKIIYFTVINHGLPMVGQERSEKNNLKLSIRYVDENDNLLNISQLKQGADFKAVVTVQNPGAMGTYKEMSLSQIFPSGWEIMNTRLFGAGSNKGDIPTYQDIRDDRVYTYFDIKPYKQKQFVIYLNAAYVGDYYLPGILCEAMYDHKINAVIAGKKVKVEK